MRGEGTGRGEGELTEVRLGWGLELGGGGVALS